MATDRTPADKALAALDAYAAVNGPGDYGPGRAYRIVPEVMHRAAADLVADLALLCEQRGIDFDTVLQRAERYHDAA